MRTGNKRQHNDLRAPLHNVICATMLPVLICVAFLRLGSLALVAPDTSEQSLGDLLASLEQRQRLDSPGSLMSTIINPYSPYFLCDYHFGGEKDFAGRDRPRSQIVITPLNVTSAKNVKPCEAICVDVLAFGRFVATILPILPANFVLMTHRSSLPQLHRSEATDAVRADKKVYHWFAQNPVYPKDDRYSPFPYGIRPNMLEAFGKAFLAYHRQRPPVFKNRTVEQMYLSKTHPSRTKLIMRHARLAPSPRGHMLAAQYYATVGQAKFVISPRGDRPDTYRHWESIALGALPIANINPEFYRSLFDEDMIYVNDTETMLDFLDRPELLEGHYHVPKSQKVSSLYWARRFDEVKARCHAETQEPIV